VETRTHKKKRGETEKPNEQEKTMERNNMRTKSNKELWWLTRVLSSLLIVFNLFSIGVSLKYASHSEPMSATSIYGLSMMGLVAIGLGLAWKWELIGGIIALLAFIGIAIVAPGGLREFLTYIYPVTAILFIILWAKNRKTTSVKNK
jgi:hypothetical protein